MPKRVAMALSEAETSFDIRADGEMVLSIARIACLERESEKKSDDRKYLKCMRIVPKHQT